ATTTEIYPLSLHDALPICRDCHSQSGLAISKWISRRDPYGAFEQIPTGKCQPDRLSHRAIAFFLSLTFRLDSRTRRAPSRKTVWLLPLHLLDFRIYTCNLHLPPRQSLLRHWALSGTIGLRIDIDLRFFGNRLEKAPETRHVDLITRSLSACFTLNSSLLFPRTYPARSSRLFAPRPQPLGRRQGPSHPPGFRRHGGMERTRPFGGFRLPNDAPRRAHLDYLQQLWTGWGDQLLFQHPRTESIKYGCRLPLLV